MIKAIREAGRVPVQRGTFYEPIQAGNGPAEPDAESDGRRSKVLEENLATA
jgi:hypothetical protein